MSKTQSKFTQQYSCTQNNTQQSMNTQKFTSFLPKNSLFLQSNLSNASSHNQDQGWNFGINFKTIKKIAFILIVFLIFGLLFDLWNFYQYLNVSKKIKKKQQVPQGQLQLYLSRLTSIIMPFRAQFYQQYIYELGRNKKWNLVIKQTENALNFASNKQKFSIHYHRAMGYCFMEKLTECKKAIEQAEKYSSKDKIQYIQNIYSILSSFGLVKSSEIPSGAQFNSPTPKIASRQSKVRKNQALSTQFL